MAGGEDVAHVHLARLREDTHYSFLECGGSNVAHIDFSDSPEEEFTEKLKVASVCSRSCLVLDGDNRMKGDRIENLGPALGGNLFVLESKEIEHLLPAEIINAWAARVAGRPANIPLGHYSKTTEPLGVILDREMGTAALGLFTEGKTIKNKDGLLTFACQFMRERPHSDWTLTQEAAELCGKLVSFVCKANGLPEG